MKRTALHQRLRPVVLPRRPLGNDLYDLANGPRNPRGYQNQFEYLDPTGEVASLLVDHFNRINH